MRLLPRAEFGHGPAVLDRLNRNRQVVGQGSEPLRARHLRANAKRRGADHGVVLGGRYRGWGTAVIGDGGTVGANHLGLCLCGRAQGLCGVERKGCAGWSARVVRGADHGADHAVTLMVALMAAHG